MNRETDEVIADSGSEIDDDLFAIIDENRAAVREVYIVKGEQKAVNIIGEDDMKFQYPVPRGVRPSMRRRSGSQGWRQAGK